MKLYYARGACSLSNRISLHEAGITFTDESVDLATGMTETGRPFRELSPKGYVPLLVLEDGERVTENIAVLSLIADRAPELLPDGDLGRVRMLEALSFISSELHIAFKPLFHQAPEQDRQQARERIAALLRLVADDMAADNLLGERFGAADAYLFVILLWARKFEVLLPPKLTAYAERVAARSSVRRALREEGLARDDDWAAAGSSGS